jgi:hypothetical protein
MKQLAFFVIPSTPSLKVLHIFQALFSPVSIFKGWSNQHFKLLHIHMATYMVDKKEKEEIILAFFLNIGIKNEQTIIASIRYLMNI